MQLYLHSVYYVISLLTVVVLIILISFYHNRWASLTHNVSAPAENLTRNIYVSVNGNGFFTLDFLHNLHVVVPGNYFQRYIQSYLWARNCALLQRFCPFLIVLCVRCFTRFAIHQNEQYWYVQSFYWTVLHYVRELWGVYHTAHYIVATSCGRNWGEQI